MEGLNQYRCTCPQRWSGSHCQHQTQTGRSNTLGLVLAVFVCPKGDSTARLFNAAPPEWSVVNDPAFSRRPRCAQVNQEQHCSCDAGFHMSGTSDSSICQGELTDSLSLLIFTVCHFEMTNAGGGLRFKTIPCACSKSSLRSQFATHKIIP